MGFFTATLTMENPTMTIVEGQKVVGWSVEAANPIATFTINGNVSISIKEVATGSTPINVGASAGTGVYNSPTLGDGLYYDSITITATAGVVSLILITA